MWYSVAKLFPMSENRFQQFQKLTSEDDIIQLVSKIFKEGWSKSKEKNNSFKIFSAVIKLKTAQMLLVGLYF